MKFSIKVINDIRQFNWKITIKSTLSRPIFDYYFSLPICPMVLASVFFSDFTIYSLTIPQMGCVKINFNI